MTERTDAVCSPLTGTDNVRLGGVLPVARIVYLYRHLFNMDVEAYFAGCSEVRIDWDRTTGYGFYWPLTLAGDGAFYEALETIEWYYMPDKWEHRQALTFISPGDHVLEWGCGAGAFLKHLRDAGVKANGLEMNAHAATVAKQQGLAVHQEDLLHHARRNEGAYDVVCGFQVLEHIAEPKPALVALLSSLRSGGRLILSVPNNDAFFKWDKRCAMNMPPHHMGLWTERSVKALGPLFDMQLERILIEPLQHYHSAWHRSATRQRRQEIWGCFGDTLNRLLVPFDAWILKRCPALVKGHTLMAVYRKR